MKLEKELQDLQHRIVDAGEFPVLAAEEKESVN